MNFLHGKVLFAQQIDGRVFDLINDQPLENASIVTDDGLGTASDGNGNFKLRTTDSTKTITISHLGYLEESIAAPFGKEPLNVGMQSNSLAMEEVVVTAHQTNSQYMRAPGAVALISKSALNRDDQVIITPAINRVPGVYMHSGTLNTNRITIRGIGSRSLFSTNKVRAYLNDIPLTTGEGETTIEDIDLNLIDRVEILKGPASSIYGVGLGGTINLEVAKAKYRATRLSTGVVAGSFGLLRNTVNFERGNDRVNINLSYNRTHSDGYRENNEYNRDAIGLITSFYPNQNSSLTFIANFIDLKAFIPSSIDSATFAENPRAAASNWKQSMGFEAYDKGIFGVSYFTKVLPQLKLHSSVFTSFRNANEPRPFNILRENSNNVGIRSRVSWMSGSSSLRYDITLGGEYFIEWFDWGTFENDNKDIGSVLSINQEIRRYFNIFSQANVHLTGKTIIVGGINVNRTFYDLEDLFVGDSIDQTGDYSFETIFSPRIGINHSVDRRINLHASASHGFSPPTLAETLTPEGLINPDIQPETGYNFEMGSRGDLWNGRLFYDVSLYTMRIRNLIVAERVGPDAFVGVNAGKTTHNGFEALFSYDLAREPTEVLSNAKITTTFTHADYEFKEFINEGQDHSGNELTGVPANKFNAILEGASAIGFYGNLNFLWVDEIPITDDNSVFSDAYKLLNGKFGFKKPVGPLVVDAHFGVNNIADEKYASMVLVNAGSFGGNAPRYFYPGNPRNYYGGVQLSYQIGE